MLSNEILLLKLIDANANLTLLRRRGLTHAQVAMLLQSQIESGFVETTTEGVLLTPLGKATLNENLNQHNYLQKRSWILPQETFYREPISKKDIFLPKKI